MPDTWLGGAWTVPVVGVSFTEFYPSNIYALDAAQRDTHREEPLPVVLIRNPLNEHDENAIEVHVPALGDIGMIGHLPRALAARLAPELDGGVVWQAHVDDVLVHPDHPENPGITVHCSRIEAAASAASAATRSRTTWRDNQPTSPALTITNQRKNMAANNNYTIDLDGRDGRWRWMLYTQGGAVRLADGSAESIEAAVDVAKTRMLVEHRAEAATRGHDNMITVCGSATRDPELRYTSGGRAVASFGVAQNERYKNDAGEWVDGATSFFNVTAWADLAEHLAESVTKGTRVIVTGKMQMRQYETNEGEKRTVWDLVAADAGPSLKWATASIAKTVRTGPRDDAPRYEDQSQDDGEPF